MIRSTATALLLVCLFAALCVTASCDTTKAPGSAVADPLAGTLYPKVAALDDFTGKIATGKPIVHLSKDQPLDVVVPLRYVSDNQAYAQYRFIFFDDHDKPLRPTMDWKYVALPARAQIFLEGSALNPAAADWRMEIRPAK